MRTNRGGGGGVGKPFTVGDAIKKMVEAKDATVKFLRNSAAIPKPCLDFLNGLLEPNHKTLGQFASLVSGETEGQPLNYK